ncbi:MAG: hypothetical protein K8F91_07935 [Candidatus Obscuribacterales bacterium]|nr:hypothetical protein [Candidatus Obscuribacterales bacterium]
MARFHKGKRRASIPVVVPERDGKFYCGTITVEDQLRMERAARRQAKIASGQNTTSGSGVHGGDKKDQKRRDRRQSKALARNWKDHQDD